MTEGEWQVCTEPDAMLRHLWQAQTTPARWRKLLLFVCACCRRLGGRMPDALSRQVLEVVERYADGLASPRDLAEARRASRGVRAGAWWAAQVALDAAEADGLV